MPGGRDNVYWSSYKLQQAIQIFQTGIVYNQTPLAAALATDVNLGAYFLTQFILQTRRIRIKGYCPSGTECAATSDSDGLCRITPGDELVSANQASVADDDLTEAGSKMPFYAISLWTLLIARIYEVFPLVYPPMRGRINDRCVAHRGGFHSAHSESYR